MSPFYLDMGFSKTQIGAITKFYGVWIGIAGVVRRRRGGRALGRMAHAVRGDRAVRVQQSAVSVADRASRASRRC